MAKRTSLIGLATIALIALALWFNSAIAWEGPDDHVAARQHRAAHAAPTGILGRTIQLEFSMQNDQENPKFPVLNTGGGYRIERDVVEAGKEHFLHFSGHVRPIDDRGRMLVTFEVKAHHLDVNDDVSATFDLEGSVVMKIGETKTLGILGDENLKLTASAVD